MTMQRRHFELIAETIRLSTGETGQQAMREHMARAFARELSATNPQFNRPRFLEACGLAS